jgi:hypothetical protein
MVRPIRLWTEGEMADSAIDYVNLTRICEFTRVLHRFHQTQGDEVIDREFNAVCRAIWGYNLDDFTDDDLSPKDHAWLDGLSQERASDFATRHGYDLKDYGHGGCVKDCWGFTWMIFAEARGLLTPENRAAAWRKYDELARCVKYNGGRVWNNLISRGESTAAKRCFRSVIAAPVPPPLP